MVTNVTFASKWSLVICIELVLRSTVHALAITSTGLADPTKVSFESVNYPVQSLWRHSVTFVNDGVFYGQGCYLSAVIEAVLTAKQDRGVPAQYMEEQAFPMYIGDGAHGAISA